MKFTAHFLIGFVFAMIGFGSCQTQKNTQTIDPSKCKSFNDDMPEFSKIKGIKNLREYDFCHNYHEESKLHIINSEEELRAIIDPKCDNTVPGFNYNITTLIGYYTTGGGCDVNFKRKVKKTGKTYNVYIKVEESGSCDMLVYNMNWIALPKLKPDENVKINIGRLTCRDF